MSQTMLNKHIAEADLRIIPHIKDSIKLIYKRLVLLSNDTDVLITVFHCMEYFTSIGLNELWMQFGTGKYKRLIPVYTCIYTCS